ncbi:unnamed protein product, partial [marine sediment metagenome]
MANSKFRVKTHGILPGNQMVEFCRDGVFVAPMPICIDQSKTKLPWPSS